MIQLLYYYPPLEENHEYERGFRTEVVWQEFFLRFFLFCMFSSPFPTLSSLLFFCSCYFVIIIILLIITIIIIIDVFIISYIVFLELLTLLYFILIFLPISPSYFLFFSSITTIRTPFILYGSLNPRSLPNPSDYGVTSRTLGTNHVPLAKRLVVKVYYSYHLFFPETEYGETLPKPHLQLTN